MNMLSRQQVIDRMLSAAQPAADGTAAANELAGWAFEQFYAVEEERLELEPGYHRALRAVLDDLMFSDQPSFRLSAAELRQMIDHLQQAEPADDDDGADDDEEDDDDTDADE